MNSQDIKIKEEVVLRAGDVHPIRESSLFASPDLYKR